MAGAERETTAGVGVEEERVEARTALQHPLRVVQVGLGLVRDVGMELRGLFRLLLFDDRRPGVGFRLRVLRRSVRCGQREKHRRQPDDPEGRGWQAFRLLEKSSSNAESAEKKDLPSQAVLLRPPLAYFASSTDTSIASVQVMSTLSPTLNFANSSLSSTRVV